MFIDITRVDLLTIRYALFLVVTLASTVCIISFRLTLT